MVVASAKSQRQKKSKNFMGFFFSFPLDRSLPRLNRNVLFPYMYNAQYFHPEQDFMLDDFHMVLIR